MEKYKKLIYLKKNSIPDETCDEIIELFENEKQKSPGITHGGLNKNVKDTDDYSIVNPENSLWLKIRAFLEIELFKNIKLYVNDFSDDFFKSGEHNFFEGSDLYISTIMVQRYIKNKGKYIYHNDFNIDYSKKSYRCFTFLWYLNDVECGGETEFFNGEFKIIPEKGKLLFFPASWTFPHSGKMPISSNKYIITGWVCTYFH